MMTREHIHATGVYQNQLTQCFEAWLVLPHSSHKQLLATCSMSVPEAQLKWWNHQVRNLVQRMLGRSS